MTGHKPNLNAMAVIKRDLDYLKEVLHRHFRKTRFSKETDLAAFLSKKKRGYTTFDSVRTTVGFALYEVDGPGVLSATVERLRDDGVCDLTEAENAFKERVYKVTTDFGWFNVNVN
jgi:hypothetical protein